MACLSTTLNSFNIISFCAQINQLIHVFVIHFVKDCESLRVFRLDKDKVHLIMQSMSATNRINHSFRKCIIQLWCFLWFLFFLVLLMIPIYWFNLLVKLSYVCHLYHLILSHAVHKLWLQFTLSSKLTFTLFTVSWFVILLIFVGLITLLLLLLLFLFNLIEFFL